MFNRKPDLYIWKRLQISGERMVRVMNGEKNGGSTMMLLVKQINGRISGAALIQPHNLMLDMLMFGMKGKKYYADSSSTFL